MVENVMSEVELFEHANRCLEFFQNYKQDNALIEGYLGARYLFKYPNSLVLSYISPREVYLYSADGSIELNLPQDQWTFKKDAGAWLSKEQFTPELLVGVVSEFKKHYGKPLLIFPWSEWIERYGPHSDEWSDLLEELDPENDAEELETFNQSQESQRVIESISGSNPDTFIFDVDRLFETGDVLIPKGSQYARYRRYCEELENLGWIIIDYMTDQGFAYEALEGEREQSDFDGVAPALISPLESVFESYSPNGELSEWFAMIDIGDGKFEDLNIAEKFGLKIELPSKNMVAILNN